MRKIIQAIRALLRPDRFMHKRKKQSNVVGDLTHQQVKAHFLLKHSSIRQWAFRNGYNPSTVNMALRGERNGRLSQEIIKKLNRGISK